MWINTALGCIATTRDYVATHTVDSQLPTHSVETLSVSDRRTAQSFCHPQGDHTEHSRRRRCVTGADRMCASGRPRRLQCVCRPSGSCRPHTVIATQSRRESGVTTIRHEWCADDTARELTSIRQSVAPRHTHIAVVPDDRLHTCQECRHGRPSRSAHPTTRRRTDGPGIAASRDETSHPRFASTLDV